ncbi:MAG: FtsQ-type POTRA domain-containing protein [Myxococcota bacterium]|jgi:cell division protein FtsQ|nr:FtsQ-type POTRA domain-containing protein [Myxococcota bacterium]
MSYSHSSRRKPVRKQTARGNRRVGKKRTGGSNRRGRSRLRLGRDSLSATPATTRLIFSLLFAASMAAGALLWPPLEERLGLWLNDDLAVLESMAIQGNRRLSFAEIAETTGIERGTPLATIDAPAIAARLTRKAWIREADVLRLPPSTLLIRVQEREPMAILVPLEASSRPARMVDASGHVFPATPSDPGLPRLIGGEGLASHHDHRVLVEALALFERLREPRFADLWVGEDPLAVHLPAQNDSEGWMLRGSVDVLLGRRDLTARIDRLAQLIRSDQILDALGGERVLIDLRFANQAVLRRGSPTSTRKRLDS